MTRNARNLGVLPSWLLLWQELRWSTRALLIINRLGHVEQVRTAELLRVAHPQSPQPRYFGPYFDSKGHFCQKFIRHWPNVLDISCSSPKTSFLLRNDCFVHRIADWHLHRHLQEPNREGSDVWISWRYLKRDNASPIKTKRRKFSCVLQRDSLMQLCFLERLYSNTSAISDSMCAKISACSSWAIIQNQMMQGLRKYISCRWCDVQTIHNRWSRV